MNPSIWRRIRHLTSFYFGNEMNFVILKVVAMARNILSIPFLLLLQNPLLVLVDA